MEEVDLMIIILGFVGGLILFLLLGFIFWKVRFYRRLWFGKNVLKEFYYNIFN